MIVHLLLRRLLNRLYIRVRVDVVVGRKLLAVFLRDLADAKLRLVHVGSFILKLVIKGFIRRSNEGGVASFWDFSLHRVGHAGI